MKIKAPVVDTKNKERHTHYWEFVSSSWQYPPNLSGTTMAVEYAYLLCRGCQVVKKVEVEHED